MKSQSTAAPERGVKPPQAKAPTRRRTPKKKKKQKSA
jgi:hypothetical protein